MLILNCTPFHCAMGRSGRRYMVQQFFIYILHERLFTTNIPSLYTIPLMRYTAHVAEDILNKAAYEKNSRKTFKCLRHTITIGEEFIK